MSSAMAVKSSGWPRWTGGLETIQSYRFGFPREAKVVFVSGHPAQWNRRRAEGTCAHRRGHVV